MDPSRLVVIVELGEPTIQSTVCRFLRHIGYYWKFISGYAKIVTSLEKLLKQKSAFPLGRGITDDVLYFKG